MVIVAVMPNCWEASRGEAISTPKPKAVVSAEPSSAEPVVARVWTAALLRAAEAGELLPVAMNHVDRVVHPDPDRQRRDDRGDQRVGNAQQRHRAQYGYEHEYDRPHRDYSQGMGWRRVSQKKMERMPRATAMVVLIA